MGLALELDGNYVGTRFSQLANVCIYTSNVFCVHVLHFTIKKKKSLKAKRIHKAETPLVRKYTASISRSQSGMHKGGKLPRLT